MELEDKLEDMKRKEKKKDKAAGKAPKNFLLDFMEETEKAINSKAKDAVNPMFKKAEFLRTREEGTSVQ